MDIQDGDRDADAEGTAGRRSGLFAGGAANESQGRRD